MNLSIIYKILKLDNLMLFPILALAFYIAFIPHQNYPYPVHIDEWNLLSYMKAMQGAGNVSFADPYSGQSVPLFSVLEAGFHLLWGVFQRISGLPWLTIFRYFPSVIFMMTVLSVYALAHRQGFGWEAAFFSCLIITTVGIIGPAFLVPVAMGLLFIPLSIILAFNFRHGWAYVTVFVFTCFLLSMHAPSAICLVLILVPHVLLNLKSNFKHSLSLTLALIIPFLAPIVLVPNLVLTTVKDLLMPQSFPWHIDFPNIIATYGYLPISLCLLGIFILAIRRDRKGHALVLGLLAMLLMLAVFYTFHYGVPIVYGRGLMFMMLMLSITAGAGLMWIKSIRIPENITARLKAHLISQNIGRMFYLALICLILVMAIPTRQNMPYYHMIDDYDYETFVWIRDNISDDYEKAILDPWKATAFTAITQKMVFTRLHSYATASTREAQDFLINGCSDTTFLRNNGISIIYSRSPCNNPDLTEMKENIYLLKEAK